MKDSEELLMLMGDNMGTRESALDKYLEIMAERDLTPEEEARFKELVGDAEAVEDLTSAVAGSEAMDSQLTHMLEKELGLETSEEASNVTSISPRAKRDGVPKSRRGFFITLGAASAIAAAAAVLIIPTVFDQAAPLPGYSMEIEGGDKSVRGGDNRFVDETLVLSQGSEVSIVLRPQTSIDDKIVLSVFAYSSGDKLLRKLEVPFTSTSEGTLLVEGTPSKLFGSLKGKQRLVIVLTRREGVSEDSLSMEDLKDRQSTHQLEMFNLNLELRD